MSLNTIHKNDYNMISNKIKTGRDTIENISKVAAEMRKHNPLMSAKQFSSITDKSKIPGFPLTSAQKAMIPKSEKRIIDGTSYLSFAELERKGM